VKRVLTVIALILLTFAIGSHANAQTSTPTPGPICGPGYYGQTASCVIYSAGWGTASIANASGGSYIGTTTVGSNLTFRMYGTSLVIYRVTVTTGGTANFCVDANCQTISFVSGSTLYMQPLAFDVDCLNICTISMTNNTAGGSNLDSFQIGANIPTDTPIPTATPLTPVATWTNQVITPLATWTAQAAATGTGFINGQYIFPNLTGFIEDTDAGITYAGNWTLDNTTAVWLGGYTHTTTSFDAYFLFTVNSATSLSFQMYGTPTTDDVLVCVSGATCSTVTGTRGSPQNFSINLDFSSPQLNSVLIKKATNNSNRIYFDRVLVVGYETPTPSVTPTPILPLTQIPPLTEIPQFTQIAPLTQVPYPTPPPYLTQIAPLTQEPQFTQVPFPTPLDTWTPYPTPAEQYTQIPFPTPLDTWTPQPHLVITFQGTVVAAIAWEGLLTIFPTLITQVPPTSTPTETLTPSITFTPSITPTPTPPGYVQFELPNADGTLVAIGTLYMEASAGEVGNMILLFFLSLIGLLFIARVIFEGRKAPV
jgi:hypothetical protein